MMMPRAQLVLVLIGIEFAILGMMVMAVRGDQNPWFGPASPFTTWNVSPPVAAVAGNSVGRLIEGGPQVSYPAGEHPALTIDIGYADLTILTHAATTYEVSVSKSEVAGPFQGTGPITAQKDGDTLRIAAGRDQRGWSMGDDRMVTVIVPAQTQVNVVKAGDIHVTGLRAPATISSTGNGFITVDDFDAASLHVTSDNGPVSLHQVSTAMLEATSRNDRVSGTGLKVENATVQADDSISLGFVAGLNATVNASASDGAVHLNGFPNAPAASKSSGDDDDSALQTVRMGNGTGHIDVHSDSGNINLSQDN